MGGCNHWLLGHSAGMLQGSSAVQNPWTGSWRRGWMGKQCLGEMLHRQSKAASLTVLSFYCSQILLVLGGWLCCCSDKAALRHLLFPFVCLGTWPCRSDSRSLTWWFLHRRGCPYCAESSLSSCFLLGIVSVGNAAFGKYFGSRAEWM